MFKFSAASFCPNQTLSPLTAKSSSTLEKPQKPQEWQLNLSLPGEDFPEVSPAAPAPRRRRTPRKPGAPSKFARVMGAALHILEEAKRAGAVSAPMTGAAIHRIVSRPGRDGSKVCINTVTNHMPAVRAQLAEIGHQLVRAKGGAYVVLLGEIWKEREKPTAPRGWAAKVRGIRARLRAKEQAQPGTPPEPSAWLSKLRAIRGIWTRFQSAKGTPKNGTIGGLASLVKTPNTHTPLRGVSSCAAFRVASDAGPWAIASRIRNELEHHVEAGPWSERIGRIGLMRVVGRSAFRRGVSSREIAHLVGRAVRHTHAAWRCDGLTTAPASYFVGVMQALVSRRPARSRSAAQERLQTDRARWQVDQQPAGPGRELRVCVEAAAPETEEDRALRAQVRSMLAQLRISLASEPVS